MGNIKFYDWTSDKGDFEARTIVIDEFEQKGQKFYNVMEQFDFSNPKIKSATIKVDEDKIEMVPPKRYKKRKSNDEYELIPVSEEVSKKIKQEQKENFRKINNILVEKLDLNRVDELIDSVSVYEKKDNINTENKDTVYGFVKEDDDSYIVAYIPEVMYKDDRKSNVIRLHEFIHLIQKLDKSFDIKCLNESQVESLAETIFENEEKDISLYSENKDKKKIIMCTNNNIDNCYMESIVFLKQMEVALGRKFYENNMINREGFYKEIADKYGRSLLTYMIGRMNKIEYGIFNDLDDKAQFINETQDVLFKEVFDKDIDTIGSMKDAISTLNKMKNMGYFRQKLYVFSESESKNYNNFAQIYDEYYRKVGRKLFYIGYSKKEIAENLEGFKYKNTDFINDLDEFGNQSAKGAYNFVKNYEERTKSQFDTKRMGVQYILGNYDEIIYRMYNKEDDKTVGVFVQESQISKIRKEMGIRDDYSLPQLVKSDFKAIVDNGGEFVDVDIQRYIVNNLKEDEIGKDPSILEK